MTHRGSSSSKISRKSRRKTKTEKKHNKWFQRGCQNKSARKGGQNGQNGQRGGSGILGGNAWAASDIRPVSGAEGPAAAPGAAPAAAGHSQKGGNSGNHYVFNPNPLPPPQSSNALVEFANKMSGGSGKHRRHKQRGSHKSRKGIKLACNRNRNRKHSQQRGGATEYLPMTASNIVRSIGDGVGGFINALQGAPTPYNSSDPTMQPIGNTSQLK